MAHAVEVEIERNYAAFKEMLDELLPENKGSYVLLHRQELRGVYATAGDAERAGYEQFKDEPYSIQLVDPEPIDLGFYSYALSHGQAGERTHPD